ncbi:MAG: hypothetical protein IPF65_03265 [Polaromonas sp.]|nr:hypothetical protein [Polaromonas sp.]
MYLDVAGAEGPGVPPGNPIHGYLDTRPGESPADLSTNTGAFSRGTGPLYSNITPVLPKSTISSPRSFTAGTSTSGGGEFIPHDMLWYAAKYGGAVYKKTGSGASTVETFTPKLKTNGDPDNYYYVNNPC